MSRVVWHPFLIYIDLWSMGEWFPGPSSSWDKSLIYLLQSKKVDQREHCMKAKYKIHKYKKWQRGHCSKAGGHLVCWRPPKSHAASSRKFDLSWGSDILTFGHLAAGTLGTACGQVMHTLCFRVKVFNCFYSWLCRYSVGMFASKSISLNFEIFIRHACTFSHWTDIDGHLSQKTEIPGYCQNMKYEGKDKQKWKHLRQVGPPTPLMILNKFFFL